MELYTACTFLILRVEGDRNILGKHVPSIQENKKTTVCVNRYRG